jgi:hypothetical protein
LKEVLLSLNLSRDAAAIRITYIYRGGIRELIIASVYLPYDLDGPPPTKEMRDIIHYNCSRKNQPIIGCDTNAQHIFWEIGRAHV